MTSTPPPEPLINLTSDRIALEVSHARLADAQARHYRRQVLRVVGICAIEFLVGYLIAMLAFHVQGRELGQGLYMLAAVVILAVPMWTLIIWYWLEHQQ